MADQESELLLTWRQIQDGWIEYRHGYPGWERRAFVVIRKNEDGTYAVRNPRKSPDNHTDR